MIAVWTRRSALAFAAAALLAACASGQPGPTVAEITIAASGDANPDPTGRPSPTLVHIYALKPGAGFGSGDYDALTGGDLGDLSDRIERVGRMMISPGEEVTASFELPDGSTELGLTAAYRDVGMSKWRVQKSVEPHEVTKLTARIGANEVVLE